MKSFLFSILLLASVASSAHAHYTYNIFQNFSVVAARGSGSLNLTALSQSTTGNPGAGLAPSTGWMLGNSSGSQMTQYLGAASGPNAFTGPSNFGSGSGTPLSSFSGQAAGILGSSRIIYVPVGYVSGNTLSLNLAQFNNASLSSLGLTEGTYTWTWGSGSSADSFTVQVGTSPVPEPSSNALLALGLFGGGYLAYRRRTKATRQS